MLYLNFSLCKNSTSSQISVPGLFYINSTFWRKKNWKSFSSFQRSKMRFLLQKQFFISFLLKPFSFSHMACSSLISVQKMSVFCLYFHFLRVADGILHKFDCCEESAVKLISEVETHSHCSLLRQFSVLQLDQVCFKKSEFTSAICLFFVWKNHFLEKSMVTRWRMEWVVTFLTSEPFKLR